MVRNVKEEIFFLYTFEPLMVVFLFIQKSKKPYKAFAGPAHNSKYISKKRKQNANDWWWMWLCNLTSPMNFSSKFLPCSTPIIKRVQRGRF